MRCVIMLNGEYGDLTAYQGLLLPGDRLICADGGANYAHRLGLVPERIIGDMDSIEAQVEEHYRAQGVTFAKYPPRKDYTDFQFCLAAAREMGADEVLLLGSLGKRLDHTLANLYSGMDLARSGCRVSHFSPDCWVHITAQDLTISGQPGDLVSVLALTEEVLGFTEEGFEYAPASQRLELSKPYAVSNVLADPSGRITVAQGVLAVLHYPRTRKA